ncbi:hypothetical protein [Paracoccus sanguinis]|uniref:hypothetical protein n=1 Tax=Paracoccus sanguinis TaxID=1545044 RepID=UPI0014517101|nr:hypothetical protein [Paracoccus sanguinis]QJD15962.1 hypothetical protein HGN31_02950 [Paracoccus sanguinis]
MTARPVFLTAGVTAFAALTGCGAPGPVPDAGKLNELANGACGRVVTTAEGVVTEFPAVDFGPGLVGMRTETVSRTGERRQRFALYDVKSSRLVRVEAPAGTALFAAVERISADEPVRQSLSRFTAAARARGFAVTEGRADSAGNARLACASRAFYGDGKPVSTAPVPTGAPVDGRLLLP